MEGRDQSEETIFKENPDIWFVSRRAKIKTNMNEPEFSELF